MGFYTESKLKKAVVHILSEAHVSKSKNGEKIAEERKYVFTNINDGISCMTLTVYMSNCKGSKALFTLSFYYSQTEEKKRRKKSFSISLVFTL